MGLYLTMLVVADQVHGEDYLWRERTWRSSSWCILSGCLFLLSSQVSVSIVTTSTLERCWVLSRPRGHVNTRKLSAYLCLTSWITGIVLASIPAAWASFSSSSACIPSLVALPGQQHVHHYTVGVLVVLNGVLMALTIVGQGFFYVTICKNELAFIFESEGSRDLVLAARLMPTAVTDACAWVVVYTLMLLTSHGVLSSTDVSFTSTMMAMVTKPSVNPFLYLLTLFLKRRRRIQQQRLVQWLGKKYIANKCR